MIDASSTTFSPGLVLVLGAMLLPVLRGTWRTAWLLALPLVTLWLVWSMPLGTSVGFQFLGYDLAPVHATSVGRLFATVFAVMAFVGAFYGLGHASVLELTSACVYAGSAIGVTFAGDLLTLFVFWELMAVGSTMVIWSARSDRAYAASFRYLLVHLLGGVVLMSGIVSHVLQTGDASVSAIPLQGISAWLILIGFLINAGAPPMSSWIADAYPEASASGTVFLSAFTTKTAVFTLWVVFPGEAILVPVGVYMIFYGIIYALLENDMRRILAYSIVNQVGFMVTGIGIGTETALNGAAAHAFTHIIYKALLLMSAGSVLLQTGRRRCTNLGGLFRSMPLTTICGSIGALAISSFPFTSGFVSKSLVTDAAAHGHMTWVWFCLVAASAGVFLHAGIKFPWFVFFHRDSNLRPPEPKWNLKLTMVFYAAACIALGLFPKYLYDILPFPVDYEPYTAEHLVSQFQLLLFAGLAFFVLLPMMKRTESISLDWDWLYRRLTPAVMALLLRWYERYESSWMAARKRWSRRLAGFFDTVFGTSGVLSRSWESGSMVLWALVFLGSYLLYFFVRQ